MNHLRQRKYASCCQLLDKESYTGFRDALIIQFLLDTMVRVSELVAIRRENVHLDDGFVKLEATETKTRTSKASTIIS